MNDDNKNEFSLTGSFRSLVAIIALLLVLSGLANIDQLMGLFAGKP